jgi:hypothetical protein
MRKVEEKKREEGMGMLVHSTEGLHTERHFLYFASEDAVSLSISHGRWCCAVLCCAVQCALSE